MSAISQQQCRQYRFLAVDSHYVAQENTSSPYHLEAREKLLQYFCAAHESLKNDENFRIQIQ